MDPSETKTTLPTLKDLTTDNITANTTAINSQSPDARLTYVLARLVTHLHDFAREVRLSTSEWRAAITFLTSVGQICSPVRQEFILLSDILGLSLLVDSIDHPKPPNSTEGSVLGPFHAHHAPDLPHGAPISSDPHGTPCLVSCSIRDHTTGDKVSDVKIDIWETDSSGHYDVQYPNSELDGRCIMHSDAQGRFTFRAIKPVSYPIPHDGPVGQLLKKLHRHPYRPAHMHFMFEKEGYDHLITALYMRGDPYEGSDAVFGVKESLLVDYDVATEEESKMYEGVKAGETPVLRYDFVLVKEEQARTLRNEKSVNALKGLGMEVRLVGEEELPVPDLD